jgi:hypothetical protein
MTDRTEPATLREVELGALRIVDRASFRHVALYGELEARLLRDGYRVALLPAAHPRWDHALLINLAFWDARGGADVLVDDVLPADVVCHMAWHHLAAGALAVDGAPLAAEALLLGEAIASAFDLYLVGRLVGHAPDSDFVQTQLPAMAEVAESAGVDGDAFAALIDGVQADPEAAFESLRALLYEVSLALLAADEADAALAALLAADDHPLGCLLHHYELAMWLQHARRAPDNASAERARALHETLVAAPVALAWLTERWLRQTP